MKTENIIFLFWAVIFILILCQFFYFGPKKRRHLNTYTEMLDGDILSYECQNTGIVINTKKRTVRIFNADKDSTFEYGNIREINYTLSEAGKIYSTGNNLNSMIKSAGANSNEQMLANQRSGIFILTDDIKKSFMENQSTNEKQNIIDQSGDLRSLASYF